MKLKFYLLLFCVLLFFELKSQSVYINEISICNVSKNLDPTYDYHGWIEIYNASNTAFELKNIFYSDSIAKPLKYKLYASRTIPAKGYALIWLNDEVRDNLGGSLNGDVDGGYFSIADIKGVILDEVYYGKQYTDVSYGRIQDGGSTWGYFVKSSCGTSNNGIDTADVPVAEPIFSISGGFYKAVLTVEINCATPGAQIFYTLDGSDPTQATNLYTGTPIIIGKSTSVRAKAFANNYLEGTIASATYMINEREPDLPVVFLTTDNKNLFNDSIGIYCVGTNGVKIMTNGDTANYNRDWTRLAHFEYLDKNKKLCLSQQVGISISGNNSRQYDLKSFVVNARKKYGKNRFDYPIFSEKPNQRVKGLILRNGGQQDSKAFIIKDAFCQGMTDVLDTDYQAYEPAVLYINTQYWGILPFREKSTDDYIYSRYNYDDNQYDLFDKGLSITGNVLKEKDIEKFVSENDIKVETNYNILKTKIDIDNFCKYIATEFHVVNTDWPTNNNKRFIPYTETGKTRWILQDLDKGFTYYSRNIVQYLRQYPPSAFYAKLIINLLENENFKEQYINTQCIVAGSVFSINRVNTRLDKYSAELKNEFPFHAQRWNEKWASEFEVGISEMRKVALILHKKTYNDLKINFDLKDTVRLEISSNEPATSITFNNLEIPVLPYTGMYFMDKSLNLTANLYANGKKFLNWEIISGTDTSYIDNNNLDLKLNNQTKVKAIYNPAELVRRKGLYINEISANNEIFVDENYNYEDWIEIYNSSDSPISMKDYYMSNDLSNSTLFKFDENAGIIPANGYGIVWCSNELLRGTMHTNFKLNKDSGVVLLSKATIDGNILIDSVTYQKHNKRASFGRWPDGGNNLVNFENPTFKKKNLKSSYDQFIYSQEFDLVSNVKQISSTDNVKVNYISNKNEIKIENLNNEKISIKLYSITGSLLKYEPQISNSYTINTTSYPSGIYLICILTNKGLQTLKIIK